jgi:hypothetical protein
MHTSSNPNLVPCPAQQTAAPVSARNSTSSTPISFASTAPTSQCIAQFHRAPNGITWQALVALVAGGGEREVGAGRAIELDASASRDPDIDPGLPQARSPFPSPLLCPRSYGFPASFSPSLPFISATPRFENIRQFSVHTPSTVNSYRQRSTQLHPPSRPVRPLKALRVLIEAGNGRSRKARTCVGDGRVWTQDLGALCQRHKRLTLLLRLIS